MIEIVWDDKFRRIFKKWSVQHPDLVPLFRERLDLFVLDSFHPLLKVHSLSGVLQGLWAMKITYDQRLIFKFMNESHTIVLLVDIGTHDKVY
jgi:mRNA-degrading endonuclease YafQ of YafQ-DinJ toxin-antitoxin module